jgi:hypothetical protein
MFVTVWYVSINHEHRDNAVLDVTGTAVALGVSQTAPIFENNSIHRAMTHAGHTDIEVSATWGC